MSFFAVQKYWIVVGMLSVLLSCKNESVEPTEILPNDQVNLWIVENMNNYYYWREQLPKQLDYSLRPDQFFASLLYKYDAALRPDGDRFSWIQENAEELQASLSGESRSTGMQFKLYRIQANSNEIVGVVLYVLPDSPADDVGIKRGDLFTKIDGQVLTTANYSRLLYGNEPEKTIQLVAIKDGEEQLVFQETEEKTISQKTLQENPILLDTLLTIGSKKIGYLVYNQFNPSPNNANGSNSYDKALQTFVGELKANGANELILDLRYNGGGYVSSARHLASLIAPNVTTKDIFAIKEYNSVMTSALTKQYGEDYFNDYFLDISENIGSQLERIIVLTSKTTASASELLINGLQPYIKVVLVGDTTVGKNVGSITIVDQAKKIKWGMQPIVSKSFNSRKQSDYTSGFTPDIYVNETIRLYPFADTRDQHLSAALDYMNILPVPNARKMNDKQEKMNTSSMQEIDNSIRVKTLNYNMFEELSEDRINSYK